MGDNLPSPKDVVSLYQRSEIQMIRLYHPSTEALQALRGSNLLVSLGVSNGDLKQLSSSQDAANSWYVAPAMNNIYNALLSIGLDRVKVTTAVPSNVLGRSYPPSAGAFTPEVAGYMKEIATFLFHTGAHLMINVYPYFAYVSDPTHISLDYALFKSKGPVVVDGSLKYYNLFDAMVDAFNAALEKIDAADVLVAISESGWPSAGNEPCTSIANAQTYNMNLINHVTKGGTPRRPEHLMDTFMFAMFNEDLKPAGVEQSFGFFHPDMKPVYPLF
uniref:Glucan endo-1,3-beta-glucosidase GVI n=1 Tax=Nelumbo nucifera TaxID=4432 RepID=A0A822XYY7_NELNU|nr:TPA_asm: hypothetical protein HUJ06_025885 [Nelumbo nucifera]